MAFKSSDLYSDEEIVLDLHPHWIIMARGVVALILSIAFGIWVMQGWKPTGAVGSVVKVIAAAAVLAALVYFLKQWVDWVSTKFVVTTDRCIFRSGVLAKSGVEIPLDRINTIFFRQTVFERLVGCGSLALESAGERGTETIEHVKNPVSVQHHIYEQIEKNENRKYDRIGRGGQASLSTADEIAKLATLMEQGHISTEEFAAHKAALLRGEPT